MEVRRCHPEWVIEDDGELVLKALPYSCLLYQGRWGAPLLDEGIEGWFMWVNVHEELNYLYVASFQNQRNRAVYRDPAWGEEPYDAYTHGDASLTPERAVASLVDRWGFMVAPPKVILQSGNYLYRHGIITNGVHIP